MYTKDKIVKLYDNICRISYDIETIRRKLNNAYVIPSHIGDRGALGTISDVDCNSEDFFPIIEWTVEHTISDLRELDHIADKIISLLDGIKIIQKE